MEVTGDKLVVGEMYVYTRNRHNIGFETLNKTFQKCFSDKMCVCVGPSTIKNPVTGYKNYWLGLDRHYFIPYKKVRFKVKYV